MVQALATLIFASSALLAAGLIVFLLREDWETVCHALGIGGRVAPSAPLPPQVRAPAARRAVMVRVEVPERRRVAA